MKTLLKLTAIVICLSFYGCKNENSTATFSNYHYTETENVLKCDGIDTKLYHEALLSFEDDIAKYYNKQNTDIRVAYTSYYRALISKQNMDFNAIASPHTMEVFNALKNQTQLINDDNSMNFDTDIFKCLTANFNDKGFGTTINSLISTNSMRLELVSAPLQNQIKLAHNDRYLAMYIALDLYYRYLGNVDPTKVTEKPEMKEELKELQAAPNQQQLNNKPDADPHAGHNHD